MNKQQRKGSNIAKEGFKNEQTVIDKFNNWRSDEDAQDWLTIMNYKLSEIEFVEAIKINGEKTDVQVQVTIKLKKAIGVENIQVKLVSQKKGFNQIDKRWVDKYSELWDIPDKISILIKKYCGQVKPTIKSPRDERRTFVDEFSNKNQKLLIDWLIANQIMILSDIIRGRGKFAAEWYLVAIRSEEISKWALKPITKVINHYSQGGVQVTAKGNLRIGKVGMQRKGGDGGRDSANMLQFKLDPTEIFNI
jgi:hypothetical protein